MKVKAVRLGYYEHKRRREGDVFTLKSAKDFSDVNREGRSGWMEKVSDNYEDDFDAEMKGKPAKVAKRNQSVI